MAEMTGRQPTRLEPTTAWNVLTDAPLKGLCLAREAGSVFAWDEGGQLYLLDLRGDHRSASRVPCKIHAAAISDDGSLVVLLAEGGQVWFLSADLEVVAERPAPPDPIGLAIDPHGRYVVVGSRLNQAQLYNRHGRPAGKFETRQAVSFFTFVPDRPILLGAATFGLLAAYEVGPGGAGRLDVSEFWEERVMSNVGRLTTTGDGGMILASCFIHGVQRFDLQGRNEGAYHLGGTAAHAVPDYAGRMIAVATLEGELIVLNSAGNVRWRNTLPRPALALETDPLGRYVIFGHDTGEIVRLDLYGSDGERPAKPKGKKVPVAIASPSGAPGASVREPAWSVRVADSAEQAETAVLTVLDDPGRIAVYTTPGRLSFFSNEGKALGRAPETTGVGRILRTAPGWIAGATDRQVVLCDARRGTVQRVDLSLVELSHLAIRPDSFGLALVQERDRAGRATIAGRWVWKTELRGAIEELAIGAEGFLGVTTEDGRLLVFDPAGASSEGYRADPAEPLCLIEAVPGAPYPVAWHTLARRNQVLRGHDANGRVVWESPVPWEAWQLHRLGPLALISAPDGRALAYDGAGHLRFQCKPTDSTTNEYGVGPSGEPWRVSKQGVHLICSEFNGRVRWRTVAREPIGPFAVGQDGVAALIGHALCWFPSTG